MTRFLAAYALLALSIGALFLVALPRLDASLAHSAVVHQERFAAVRGIN